MVPLGRADVRIVTTDIPAEVFQRLAEFACPYGIFLDALPSSRFCGFDRKAFNKTHVPVSALGRFFMLEAVHENYDRILYLDGDTWPVGDPSQLFEVELPEGYLGAAEDRNYFRRHEMGPVGRKTRAYFSGLGIDGNSGYFSSGVLLADSKTWREVSADAFTFFARHTERCLYHDQSALNVVARARWVRLAPRWNFMNAYLEWGLRYTAAPQILHFAGGDKPWDVPFHPFHQTYAAAFAPLQRLGLPTLRLSQERLDALRRRARLRKLRDELFVHRKLYYQMTFDRLVGAAVVR